MIADVGRWKALNKNDASADAHGRATMAMAAAPRHVPAGSAQSPTPLGHWKPRRARGHERVRAAGQNRRRGLWNGHPSQAAGHGRAGRHQEGQAAAGRVGQGRARDDGLAETVPPKRERQSRGRASVQSPPRLTPSVLEQVIAMHETFPHAGALSRRRDCHPASTPLSLQ